MIDFYSHELLVMMIEDAHVERDKVKSSALYLGVIARLLYNQAREED